MTKQFFGGISFLFSPWVLKKILKKDVDGHKIVTSHTWHTFHNWFPNQHPHSVGSRVDWHLIKCPTGKQGTSYLFLTWCLYRSSYCTGQLPSVSPRLLASPWTPTLACFSWFILRLCLSGFHFGTKNCSLHAKRGIKTFSAQSDLMF